MTPLQWALLCVFFTLYLLFGGGVFMYFEQHREIEQKEEISVLRKDVKEILLELDKEFYSNETSQEIIDAIRAAKESVIIRISDASGLGNLLADEPELNASEGSSQLKWTFYNSVFFAFTVVTTIGYGHLSPSTSWSKGFVFIYALFGIPINTLLLTGVGDYFSSRLTKVHQKSKEKRANQSKSKTSIAFFFEILFYLIPGMIIFIIIPAGLFNVIEGWTYFDSVYYAFVSLTTIGFGDYVAGMGDGTTVWMWVYKSFIIIWITFGLGYLIMILGFISKGMTSKQVRVVIERRLNTIRFTKEKLSKDIDYMRRVVNELYLMKIKPVYEVENEVEDFKAKSKRTQSQPCIRFERRFSSLPRLGHHGQMPPISPSKSFEALSDTKNQKEVESSPNSSRKTPKLLRRCSDGDLTTIDRDKTFETAIQNNVTADELLVTVVNALSGGVMNNVMEAVDELNGYEEEVATGVYLQEAEGVTAAGSGYANDHSDEDDDAFDDVPSWDLGALSESDEEVLIGEDGIGNDSLKEVVVQGDDDTNNSSLMQRVTGAIRKISSGSRTPSEGPSRRVSRNESIRNSLRKISRNESFERKISSNGSHPRPQRFKNPLAHGGDRKISHVPDQRKISHMSDQRKISHMSDQRKISHMSDKRKISEESGISNLSTRSHRTIEDFMPNSHSSPALKTTKGVSPTPSRLSLQTTSLAEFLKALDNVHQRLNVKTSVGAESNRSSEFDCQVSQDTGFSPWSPIRKSARKLSNPSPGQDDSRRRRKNGIFHPDFAYVNHGFVFESDGKNDLKDMPDPHKK